jgi:hypothetical protein
MQHLGNRDRESHPNLSWRPPLAIIGDGALIDTYDTTPRACARGRQVAPDAASCVGCHILFRGMLRTAWRSAPFQRLTGVRLQFCSSLDSQHADYAGPGAAMRIDTFTASQILASGSARIGSHGILACLIVIVAPHMMILQHKALRAV